MRRVNRVRANHGVPKLKFGGCLTRQVARPWARHMARTQDMVHQDIGVVFDRCHGFNAAGENIAAGYPNVASVMRGWLNSSGHRANILSADFTRIGIGVARASDGTRYWVQDFGG
jgi:uncharacterized protein YkwD